MSSNLDDDGYWNRSGRAFNFDDEEDIDLKSLASLEISADGVGGGGILNDDTISEASFDNSSAASGYNLSIKSLISDEELKLLLDEQSMDDNMIPKGMKPEEELKLLRRQIQNTLYSPSPATTACKLLCGKIVGFEVFRSLQDKQELLDAVLNIGGGGDAVLSVVLFLEKSLNRKDFLEILKKRPKALQHYIVYLTQRHPDAAIDLLNDLGKYNEAMLLEFQTVLRLESLVERKAKLLAMMTHCANNRVCTIYQQMLHAALKLFGLVDTERSTLSNLVDASPVEVLYACCAKNTNWKDPDISQTISPYRLCTEQHISSGQFDWTALNERCQAQAYADLKHIFEQVPTFSMNPMKQKQFHINISLELAILRLYELGAPSSIIHMFLTNMGNASDKLELAKRVKCTKAIVDALATLRDVPQLLQIRDSLPERSEEQFYCDNAIKNAQTKRWTTDSIKLKL